MSNNNNNYNYFFLLVIAIKVVSTTYMHWYRNRKVIILGLEERKQYQDDVAAIDINLQVRRNGGCAIGDSTRTVGLSSDKINGDREVNFANKVSEEDECASDNADEDGRRWRSRKIMNDLSGELGDSERDLVLVPKDSFYVGLHCHGDSRRMGGFLFLLFQLVCSHSHSPPPHIPYLN